MVARDFCAKTRFALFPGMTNGLPIAPQLRHALPIDAVLDDLSRTLEAHTAAVLVAPPGAGKTTRVPLALLDAPWAKGKKIIVLEPRRIAARASADRMAKSLGERAGETVGYRVRFGSKISRATRIEVVTEGILRARSSMTPSSPALRPSCSTNSTNARSTPILASRWRAMRNWACARICASW